MLYCIFFIVKEIYCFNWMKDILSRVLIWFKSHAASDVRDCQMEPLTNVKQNRITACVDLTCPTYIMCNHSMSLSLPVSPQWSQQSSTWVFMSTASGPCPPSIWWVQVFASTFSHRQMLASSDMTMAALRRGWGVVVSVLEKERRDRWMGFPPSPGSARIQLLSLKSRGGIDLCYGSSPLSGQAASLCGRDAASAQVWQSITVLHCSPRSMFSPPAVPEELEWWGGANLIEVQGIDRPIH